MLAVADNKRELVDESLRESQRRLHAVIENMAEGVVISDLEGHLLHWNRAALALHGFTNSEEWCRHLDDFANVFEISTLDGEVVSLEDWPMSRLLRGERLEKHERCIRRLNTDWQRIMSYGGSIVLDAIGNQIAFLTITDVTEQKQALQAIAQYNERLRMLHQIDRALIAGESPEAIAAATLPLLRDLLGVRRAILNIFDLAAGEVEWLAAAGRRRVHVGRGVRYSIRLMGDVEALRKGEIQCINVHALPPGPEVDALLRSGVDDYIVVPMIVEGDLIGALSLGGGKTPFSDEQIGIAKEVAAQFAIALMHARLHENVRRQAQELRSAFEDTNVAMVLTDINHRFVRVNAAFARMFGYSQEEILGMSMPDITYPDDIAESYAQRELLKAGKVSHFQIEKRYRHKDGRIVWGLANVSLIRGADGQPLQYVGQLQDITDRKQLEEQYRQAQKMEAIGTLAGGVAHDFNNLLTVIMGYSEVYLSTLRPEDPLRMPLTEIKKAGERATGLTRQLLAFSRKQVLMPAVLDLNTILADMAKMLNRLIGEDIALKILPSSDLWKVKADPGQMEQVMMNLVVNARDAMPLGGKLLLETKNVAIDGGYLQTHTQLSPGDYVLLAITDTGTGMDAATKARIFEPFFTTKGPTKGTGLGLATVYGIVKQSGGQIEVYSEVGQGTTFKIYLPRDKSGQASNSVARVFTPLRGGAETVLLVEDEEGIRTLAKTVLQKYGYTVIEARNGGEAFMFCEANAKPIELLLTDVVMPNMSGRQLSERLAAFQPKMKTLYMSGYTDDAIVHHGVLEPGTPFLQKPFHPEEMARKVREILDQ